MRSGMKSAEYLADKKSYVIPLRAWNYNPYALPISVRLMKMLRENNVDRLGDLQRWAPHDVMLQKNCGRGTCKELARLLQKVSDGKYDRKYQIGDNPTSAEVVKLIDEVLKRLPVKKREIILRHLGAEEGVNQKIADLADSNRVTKSYVGRVVLESAERLLQYGGTGFKVLFKNISDDCSERVCPLTPALLSSWLVKSGMRPRFSVVFYVRLIGKLCPDIPAWPDGPAPRSPREGRERMIAIAVEETMNGNAAGLFAKEVYEGVVRLLPDATPTEFLAFLRCSRTVVLSFPTPDSLTVTLKRTGRDSKKPVSVRHRKITRLTGVPR